MGDAVGLSERGEVVLSLRDAAMGDGGRTLVGLGFDWRRHSCSLGIALWTVMSSTKVTLLAEGGSRCGELGYEVHLPKKLPPQTDDFMPEH